MFLFIKYKLLNEIEVVLGIKLFKVTLLFGGNLDFCKIMNLKTSVFKCYNLHKNAKIMLF